MQIADEELRNLYASECEEHLQSLDEGLLRVESAPDDAAVLESLFRAAHSLKGSSRMVGAARVEAVAHAMEDALGQARRELVTLSTDDLDRLAIGLDALRLLVNEAIKGAPSNLDITQTLKAIARDDANDAAAISSTRNDLHSNQNAPNAISAESVAHSKTPNSAFAPNDATTLAPRAFTSQVSDARVLAPTVLALRDESALSPGKSTTSISPASASSDFKIQTMRVPPARLDALMALAGELAVTTSRVARGLSSLGEIGEICDAWSRDLARRGRQLARQKNIDASDCLVLRAALQAEETRLSQLQQLWAEFHAVVPNAARLSAVAEDIEESVRNVRLLPLSTVFNFFPRLARDLARQQGKDIAFEMEGGDAHADKRVLEEIKDPLMHMLRNAIDHGIETPDERAQSGKPRAATLRLRARRGAAELTIQVSDDGRGLDEEKIARVALQRGLLTTEELDSMSREQLQMLIFAPGFSTSATVSNVSGRGVGMDVVRHNIERLKGTLSTDSVRGRGCVFTIRLPLTLSTTRVLLVEAGKQTYALPIESVHNLVRLRREQLFLSNGRPAWIQNDEAISLVPLTQLLQISPISSTRSDDDIVSCVILEADDEKIGVQVDEFCDEQEVVWKSLGPLLKRVRNVAGSTILSDGCVCLVLNAQDLVRSARAKRSRVVQNEIALPEVASEDAAPRARTILLVEDSITTRMQEKRVLESAGYDVVTAVDGLDGLAKLESRDFDAVVSDVDMPNLNGLQMTAKIRENTSLRDMPIVLITTLSSDEDKQRGLEAGADAYLAKTAFDQKMLIETLQRLVA